MTSSSESKNTTTIHPHGKTERKQEDKISLGSFLVTFPKVVAKRVKRLFTKKKNHGKDTSTSSKILDKASSKMLKRDDVTVPRAKMSEKKPALHSSEQQDVSHQLQEKSSEKIAAIKKLGVDELEDIARSEGLNDLIGLNKEEIVEQLCDYYSSTEYHQKHGEHADHDTDELNKDDLYRRAKELDISGRSRMTKEELKDAVDSAS